MKRTESEIEKLFLAYENQVLEIATREFEKTVKPWLQKRGFSFLTGNGTFLILDKNNMQFDADDAPQNVRDILYMNIPGMGGNDLGSLMPDFDQR